VPHLVNGGLSYLQYAGDTFILLQYSPEILMNVRLILFCYEAMSGMKINFEKSEIFIVCGASILAHSPCVIPNLAGG
jgi:hypothetical protein